MYQNLTVYTIGHSNHPYSAFIALLRSANITAVADVRTNPFSRHFPQFNQNELKESLCLDGFSYVFLGRELGGRPVSRDAYTDGVADYERMATTESFRYGLKRVTEGAQKFRIALMCSEQNPLDCHRCLLVGRALAELGMVVRHILSDGRVTSHAEIEQSLLQVAGRASDDLLMSRDERLRIAYQERAQKVAYADRGKADLLDASGVNDA